MARSGPRHVSDIITVLADLPETPPHTADSLRGEPFRYHEGCPCADCMRIYLRASNG